MAQNDSGAEPRQRRPSKRQKDLLDITRLVEAHPTFWERLPPVLQQIVPRP